ncbi:MAG TPA: Rieske 2Fe-2S domain-containing protein [Chloroflexota bacterium]|nr:Rieske 2Fe-2S domain-containing protein [Chloroflexota bacterium]
MLIEEENELLTRVGRGTPMGELFRRFWLPALESADLGGPDGTPARLRILGENLLAFRDSTGKVGVVDAYCAHRRAQLYWGRNEDRGLRCVYHGWKYDIEGHCLDMPSEPAASDFKAKIRLKSYPVQEHGGLVWVYMGPEDLQPAFPRLLWAEVPDGQRLMRHWFHESSWLQAVEGELDTAHVSYLHRWFDTGQAPSSALRTDITARDAAPVLTVSETDCGFTYGSRRLAGEGKYYWRLTQWIAPSLAMFPARKEPQAGRFWVPVDDEHTLSFTFFYHPSRALTLEDTAGPRSGREIFSEVERAEVRLPDGYRIDTWRAKRNVDNRYGIDRAMQKTTNFTGIYGIPDQDRAVTESMGGIVDRSQEHLGTSDTAIIAARRRLLKMVRDLQAGIEPYGAQHGDSFAVRPLDVVSAQAELQDLLKEYAAQLTV